MRVKRLKMSAFRGIGDLTLEFHETGPTVFAGINGSGKTSILDCLAVLLSHFVAELQDPTGIGRFSNEQELSEAQKINRHFFTLDDITKGNKKTQNEITVSLEDQEISWFLYVSKLRERSRGADVRELEGICLGMKNRLQTSPEINLPLPVYYPVNREFCDDIPQLVNDSYWSQRLMVYNQALTGVRISFKSFFEWFKPLEDVENELRRDDPNHRDRQLEAVRQAISALIPGFSNLRVRRSPLRMTVTKQEQELIINQLSDGEKGLLALAADLARRLAIANPGLANPLQGSGIVLIDEIELHLHPEWQREIIPKLTKTFPNCQLIITTYSPQVISGVGLDNIYILDKTPERIIAKRPEHSCWRGSVLETLVSPPKIQDSLSELFRLVERGELEKAKQLQQQIVAQIGMDEPE